MGSSMGNCAYHRHERKFSEEISSHALLFCNITRTREGETTVFKRDAFLELRKTRVLARGTAV